MEEALQNKTHGEINSSPFVPSLTGKTTTSTIKVSTVDPAYVPRHGKWRFEEGNSLIWEAFNNVETLVSIN